jgi:nicotinamidase-related amidase
VSATTPYAWRDDGSLGPHTTDLVVCGAQRQLVDAVADATVVVDRVTVLAGCLRPLGVRVVWVRHGIRATRRGVGLLPVRATPGWELAVEPDPADVIVDGGGWDGSFASDLDDVLRCAGRRAVVLAGVASELTVDSTVRTLNDRGHECIVLVDGCAPLDPELGARAHHSLTMSGGILGALGTIANLTAALAAPTSEEDEP